MDSGAADQLRANSAAWLEGQRRLGLALVTGKDFAFETTLGGSTVTETIERAFETHDVFMWYCGLESVQKHLDRVALRVSQGGHNIPEAKIRERFTSSPANLIRLMPGLSGLQVLDNSADADSEMVIPSPVTVLSMRDGKICLPQAGDISKSVGPSQWASQILEAADDLRVRAGRKRGRPLERLSL